MNSLVLIGVILLGVILVVVALIVIFKQPKPAPVKKREIEEEYIEFEDLMAIVKNPDATSERLLYALEKFNEKYIIDDETEQKYLIFLSRILTHKNVNKDLFQYFHKEIKTKNPKYKNDLELIEKKALG